MMTDNDRQKLILETIVREYIDSAEPVSSKKLEKKYSFGVCPATIRNEMQELTQLGFLFQPHISAGRIPTDKAYRFFVNGILEKDLATKAPWEIKKKRIDSRKNLIWFVQALTKELASTSSSLAMSYLCCDSVLWKEGWEELFQEPEFRTADRISDFVKFIRNFEEEIDELEMNSDIQVFIGKENRLPRSSEFSLIIGKCLFPEKKEGFVSLLGPKRMAYDRNIALIHSLRETISAL